MSLKIVTNYGIGQKINAFQGNTPLSIWTLCFIESFDSS